MQSHALTSFRFFIIQGHIEKLNKEKKKHQQDDIALVKAYLKKKKAEGTTAAITKAKQKIFEGSCYGKQLTRLEIPFNFKSR